MFNTNIRQVATAAIAALIVSTACVGATVGPVQASTPQTVQTVR
jgi:hypothetical protein